MAIDYHVHSFPEQVRVIALGVRNMPGQRSWICDIFTAMFHCRTPTHISSQRKQRLVPSTSFSARRGLGSMLSVVTPEPKRVFHPVIPRH